MYLVVHALNLHCCGVECRQLSDAGSLVSVLLTRFGPHWSRHTKTITQEPATKSCLHSTPQLCKLKVCYHLCMKRKQFLAFPVQNSSNHIIHILFEYFPELEWLRIPVTPLYIPQVHFYAGCSHNPPSNVE